MTGNNHLIRFFCLKIINLKLFNFFQTFFRALRALKKFDKKHVCLDYPIQCAVRIYFFIKNNIVYIHALLLLLLKCYNFVNSSIFSNMVCSFGSGAVIEKLSIFVTRS